eukprot:TRINITY_DN1152_c0_g1_i1.p1 TRINITY_DN1152_c0_g1~~TRINITY_DN1152_c0_g1_i1.p1  ORF type:complete len:231 (-),score=42.74 TRINITY_DN1152_c0_g1_i1:137-829(-)
MLSVITPGSTQQCIPSTSSYVHGDYHARWQTSSWAQHPAAYFFPGGGSPYPSSTPYHPVKSRKDYSKPLYVDCSIEYELPNAPKVPKHSEPILMIHPDYSSNKSNPTPSAKKTVQHSRSLKRSYGQSFSEEIMLSQANFIQHQLHFRRNNHPVGGTPSHNHLHHLLYSNNSSSSSNIPPSKRPCSSINDTSCLQRVRQAEIRVYQQRLRMNLRIGAVAMRNNPHSHALWT